MYTEEYPRVLAFCRHRVGDLSTAEDLTAEVFRIAWERLGDDPPGPGWLFVTAKHVMANHRRAAIRLVEVLRVAAREARPSPAPDADLRVAAAMDALPEAQRTVLLLSYWDELTGAECGAVLGCSVPAVWMRLTRARAAFKTIFTTLEVQP
jgi:RNA polymerase sigma-70 factor (ECF subfamily)